VPVALDEGIVDTSWIFLVDSFACDNMRETPQRIGQSHERIVLVDLIESLMCDIIHFDFHPTRFHRTTTAHCAGELISGIAHHRLGFARRADKRR
jgi:hypothetical protein